MTKKKRKRTEKKTKKNFFCRHSKVVKRLNNVKDRKTSKNCFVVVHLKVVKDPKSCTKKSCILLICQIQCVIITVYYCLPIKSLSLFNCWFKTKIFIHVLYHLSSTYHHHPPKNQSHGLVPMNIVSTEWTCTCACGDGCTDVYVINLMLWCMKRGLQSWSKLAAGITFDLQICGDCEFS